MRSPTNPIHPGEILLEEFLKPAETTQAAFASKIGWTPGRLSELIHGKRGINAEAALDLAAALGTTAKLWMNLQATSTSTARRGSDVPQRDDRTLRACTPTAPCAKGPRAPCFPVFEPVVGDVFDVRAVACLRRAYFAASGVLASCSSISTVSASISRLV